MNDRYSDEALARRFGISTEQLVHRAVALAALIAVGGTALIVAALT